MIKGISLGKWVLYAVAALFVGVFVYQIMVTDLFIPNSLQNLQRIFVAAFTPRFDAVTLGNMLTGYQNTLIYSIAGFFAGIAIGLLLSYFSTRFRKSKVLGLATAVVFRSTHEVVFMYLLVLIFGLNPFIAIMAIGISFGGIQSKVFTDNMNLVSDTSFLAYKNRGYKYRGNFFYNLFPNSFNSNLNYVSYRYECAIRSAVVLSYIGLPGIGLHIHHTMTDADYNALFAYIYSLIIFILLFSMLTAWALEKIQYRIGKFLKWFIPGAVVLSGVFLITHFREFLGLFQMRNWQGIVRSGEAVVNVINPFNGDFFNADNLSRFWSATVDTVVLGVLATVFLVVLFTALLLHYFHGFTKGSKIHLAVNNAVSVINRSVPDVVFMVLLLFIMRPNIVTGALALALHNFGILTKLIKDRVVGNYKKTFTAYKNRRFKSVSMFFFLFLPLMGKDLVNLLSYRFEMMIKSSAVIGILGGGGLGLLLRLEMSRFNFEAIYFIVILYVILFLIIDRINAVISR
ncbi:MAG: hypothetical protein FWB98_05935 [Defluviitaleaceae bacterium]|nr:hypothetical protein [Defluviitaleaceae bacterium]MCL2235959.1 hypothetical protein [Defluviitaleaceae bacterium]